MINQALFDEIADLLVERGLRVTYDSVNEVLKERDRAEGGPGRGKSDRDLQHPFADWRKRRRYRPHLARLDLPEDMDKAIATFVERAMTVAAHQSGNGPPAEPQIPTEPDQAMSRQFAEFSVSVKAQITSLTETLRSRHDEFDTVPSDDPEPEYRTAMLAPSAPRPAIVREDRRRGLAAATGRFFWDKMMQGFAEAIRERGPMTPSELMETLDDDALAMAKAVFEEVTPTVIKEKVGVRIAAGKLFRVADDGRYALLPKHGPRAKRKENG